MKQYDHAKIEKEWQKEWDKQKLYEVEDNVKGKDNFYQLVEFTYPSGNLHVGHWYAFAVPDIFARFKRMQGFNVLYPMGFDAFGLPAENAAIKLGADPKEWTYTQMEKMREQFKSMGAMFPWDREVVSCAPEYYKWTQWMFNQFLKRDLVYRDITMVNWCPKDKTILANEQVADGKCDRCGADVIQREQPQWMLRITKYADRLIDDLDALEWPEEIKSAQRNWIGRSEGSEIFFNLNFTSRPELNKNRDPEGNSARLSVFTTRADTLFGATYIVLAPEHPWITLALDENHKGVLDNADEVRVYVEATKKKSELDRKQQKEKTGIEVKGVKAINPANGEEVAVWLADYVLAGYGTGAVMAVPAHDERDFEFAKKYNLSIKQVVAPETGTKRENEEFRDGGCGIIFNPTSQKYAGLYLKSHNKILFCAGGPDNKESIEDCVKREVIEESGFYDFKLQKFIETGYPHYFNTLKKLNRVAKATAYLFILNSTDRKEQQLESHEEFEVRWYSAEEIIADFKKNNADGGAEHYIRFFEQAVATAVDLGFDTTSKGFKIEPHIGEGIIINSAKFSGLHSSEARTKITEAVGGKMVKTYRLRDWGISRQRYWGTPIPIVYDPEGKANPVPDEHLPWLLPTDVDHTPDGTAPLARSKELFERTEKLFGKGWKPEVETMDAFVDSTWYFYRYLDNKNNSLFVSKEAMDTWMPLDLYMGGAEHTTMHLLYSRFWNKGLYDMGLVKDDEPYVLRRNRGIILGTDGNKMSKSKGNVVAPDEVVNRLGADTVRMYLAFIGPYGVVNHAPWDPNGVVGVRRFLERVWTYFDLWQDNRKKDLKEGDSIGYYSGKVINKTDSILNKTIKKITEDIEEFKFNTAISSMMIFLNEVYKEKREAMSSGGEILSSESYQLTDFQMRSFLILLAPFAPHMTEELWSELGEKDSIHLSEWPKWDEEKIVDEAINIVIQVNGKVRAEMKAASDMDEETIKNQALKDDRVKAWIEGKEIKRVIYVKGRLVNIVL